MSRHKIENIEWKHNLFDQNICALISIYHFKLFVCLILYYFLKLLYSLTHTISLSSHISPLGDCCQVHYHLDFLFNRLIRLLRKVLMKDKSSFIGFKDIFRYFIIHLQDISKVLLIYMLVNIATKKYFRIIFLSVIHHE